MKTNTNQWILVGWLALGAFTVACGKSTDDLPDGGIGNNGGEGGGGIVIPGGGGDDTGGTGGGIEGPDGGPGPGTGGDNPGGGTDSGGSNPGGSNPGGSDPGGSSPGGSNPGGSNPGGSNPGGSNSGGGGAGGAAGNAGEGGAGGNQTPERQDCDEPTAEDCYDLSTCNGVEEIQFLEQCAGARLYEFDNADRISNFPDPYTGKEDLPDL